MAETYDEDRLQTEAKHFILKRYLQALSNKLLQGSFTTLTYVDGFSGPWKSATADYTDTSFMIALGVLKDAHDRARAGGRRKRVQCIFVEEKASSYAQLVAAVSPYHDPSSDFLVYTFNGRFENAIQHIDAIVGTSFSLTFIDPTGWTGYEFEKIASVLSHRPGEVLVNYMKSFIDRFTSKDTHKNANFEGILGANWQSRLDPSVTRAEAVQRLFAEELGRYGGFKYVVSTPIEKLQDRTAFCIVYGTRTESGLETYREEEFRALKNHGVRRIVTKQAKETAKTGQMDLLASAGVMPNAPIEEQVTEFMAEAREALVASLMNQGSRPFAKIWPPLLDGFTIRKTNVKDICVELARDGVITAPWRECTPKRTKPNDEDLISLA